MYFFDGPQVSSIPRNTPKSLGYRSSKHGVKAQSWVDLTECKYAKLREAEDRWKFEQERIKLEEELREKRFRSLDHGYSSTNPLSPRIKSFISELKGETEGDYERRVWAFHRNEVSTELKTDVARAMLLSQSACGLFDEIAANLTESVLKDFTDWDSVLFSISNRLGYFTWKQLIDDPLEDYFKPGRGFYSDESDPTLRASAILELKLKNGSVKLLLKVAPNGSGLSWKLRGSSVFKAAHKKLVADLNGVLSDYKNRLDWVREYQEAPFYPGYTDDEVKRVGESIRHFYIQQAPELNFLRPGVYIAEQFTIMDKDRSRIYPLRCMSCQRTVALECISDLRGEGNWSGSGVKDGLHISEIIPKPARSVLKVLHGASGCEDSEAVSVRTGKPTPVRD